VLTLVLIIRVAVLTIRVIAPSVRTAPLALVTHALDV